MKPYFSHITLIRLLRTTLGVLLGVLFCTNIAFAQQLIQGKITDEKGEPLPGVSILLKGTTTGTAADADVTVPSSDAVLVFSFLGNKTQEIAVGNQNMIDISLSEDAASLDDVVFTEVFDPRTRMQASVAISTLGKIGNP